MCTETFRRLPEEKRTRFLDAAWAEFTRTSFPDVSINRIVQTAGVPRGSFYQYFADKGDLFRYLMISVGDYYIGAYRDLIQEMDGDLFRAQEEAFARFTGEDRDKDPMFGPCLRLLQLNPAMIIQLIAEDSPENPVLKQVRPCINVSALRSRDDFYVGQVFHLALLTLANAVRDTIFDPEHTEEHRRALHQRLEIIQQGCLAQSRI